HCQVDEVMSGASYYSQNDLVLHFGLGGAAQVDLLQVEWPSGLVQRWKNVKSNQKLRLVEGGDDPQKENEISGSGVTIQRNRRYRQRSDQLCSAIASLGTALVADSAEV